MRVWGRVSERENVRAGHNDSQGVPLDGPWTARTAGRREQHAIPRGKQKKEECERENDWTTCLQQLGALYSVASTSDSDIVPSMLKKGSFRNGLPALDAEPDLTDLGRVIAQLPLDPPLCKSFDSNRSIHYSSIPSFSSNVALRRCSPLPQPNRHIGGCYEQQGSLWVYLVQSWVKRVLEKKVIVFPENFWPTTVYSFKNGR